MSALSSGQQLLNGLDRPYLEDSGNWFSLGQKKRDSLRLVAPDRPNLGKKFLVLGDRSFVVDDVFDEIVGTV